MINTKNFRSITDSVLKSYSQIFFSENLFFAIILFLVSFLDHLAGFCGFLAVITSNLSAYLFGFNKVTIKKGLYGFNALLVGLGIGLYFQASLQLFIIVFFSSLLTLFAGLALQGILSKYRLPFLSIPFLLGTWAIILATRDFSALDLSERGIYTYNELYALGGKTFVGIYDWFNDIQGFESLKIYFLSLGAIFFQNNILAGILISIGLIYYSRIAFTLSFFGFYSAYFFYKILGADFSQLAYTFIGFNYILTSIALGGYFVLPSLRSYFWTLLLLPVTVIITLSLDKIFSIWQLPIYSLPFNIVVLLFIYILKLRVTKGPSLSNNFIRQSTPEKSLYLNKVHEQEIKDKNYWPVSMPFWGEWTVMQAHNGKYTHKENWKHAWDFVITDSDGNQNKNSGEALEDYLCYGKTIIAPADGIITDLFDGIDDNKIGDINTQQNWGNSIVIKHTDLLYSQLSHLKSGSFKVKKGDYVKKGDIIGLVGNSGHSPYPHLHFQMQSTPYLGSETLDYPLSNYIHLSEGNPEYIPFGKPNLNDKISPAEKDDLLDDAFHLIPGQVLNVISKKQDIKNEIKWEVNKTIYNETYIYCNRSKASAYFIKDDVGFTFTNFYGNKKSELFQFFSSVYTIKTSFYKGVIIESYIRPNLFFNKVLIFFQDFIAPFYLFSKSKYMLNYLESDDDFNPEQINLNSKITKTIFGSDKIYSSSEIHIEKKGKIRIDTEISNVKESMEINTD